MTLLCSLPGCRIFQVSRGGRDALLVFAEARRDHARCPDCKTASTSVHSRYCRRPADPPVSGRAVCLDLAVRRFYCHHPSCPRRTFAERLPHLLDRHAHRTRRLTTAQARTALALGGAPAARLLTHLAMPTAPGRCCGRFAACRFRPGTGQTSLVSTTGLCARGGPMPPSWLTSSAGAPSIFCRIARLPPWRLGFDISHRSSS